MKETYFSGCVTITHDSCPSGMHLGKIEEGKNMTWLWGKREVLQRHFVIPLYTKTSYKKQKGWEIAKNYHIDQA